MKAGGFKGCPTEGWNRVLRGVTKKLIQPMTIASRVFKGVGGKLPVICIFGCDDLRLVTPTSEDYEEKRLDCRCYPTDSNLEQVLIRDKPHVIITIGDRSSFPSLQRHLSTSEGNGSTMMPFRT